MNNLFDVLLRKPTQFIPYLQKFDVALALVIPNSIEAQELANSADWQKLYAGLAGNLFRDARRNGARATASSCADVAERAARTVASKRRRMEDCLESRFRKSAQDAKWSFWPFLPIKPVDAVDPRWLALPPQQDEQATIAETPPLIGKIAQPGTQNRVRRPPRAIADHLPVRADNRAGPPFRQAHRRPVDARPRRAWRRALHFFESSSRSAAASSICSARSFFSLAFSSSKALSRLASETSMPPNLAFQL